MKKRWIIRGERKTKMTVALRMKRSKEWKLGGKGKRGIDKYREEERRNR